MVYFKRPTILHTCPLERDYTVDNELQKITLPLFPLTCMSHAQHEPYGRRKRFGTIIHKLYVCWVEVTQVCSGFS